ncbi:DUF5688 family protein, partial [Ohessyouella blattaphilus]
MFNQFAKDIEEELRDYIADHGITATVHLNNVLKRNDVSRQGVIIRDAQSEIAPVIYLDPYFDDYQKGKDIESIVKELIQIYETNKDAQKKLNISNIHEFEKVKNNLGLGVVNATKSLEMLSDIPYRGMEDLAAYCTLIISDRNDNYGQIKVTNSLLEKWGVGFDEVYNIALQNNHAHNTFCLYNMEDIMSEMLNHTTPENMLGRKQIDEKKQAGMYVLSNEPRTGGATAILREDVMEQVSQALGGDYYILPSSTHELICLKKQDAPSATELGEMVRDVNST